MAVFDILLFALFALAVVLFGALLGGYVYKVFAGEKSLLDGVASPIENALFRVCGIDTSKSQSFKEYTLSLMVFNITGIVLLFCMLFFQNLLPLNPQNFTGLNWHLALNTAARVR
jgi:K+-transporting ATPase ATPase A chain